MVRDALELEEDRPHREGVRIRHRAVARLEDFGKAGRGGDRGVAGARLGERELARDRAFGLHDLRLDAAGLVAEEYLEVVDVLAHALEAEVPGLDDAGVHRPHRDLVRGVALERRDRGRVRVVPERVQEAPRLGFGRE